MKATGPLSEPERSRRDDRRDPGVPAVATVTSVRTNLPVAVDDSAAGGERGRSVRPRALRLSVHPSRRHDRQREPDASRLDRLLPRGAARRHEIPDAAHDRLADLLRDALRAAAADAGVRQRDRVRCRPRRRPHAASDAELAAEARRPTARRSSTGSRCSTRPTAGATSASCCWRGGGRNRPPRTRPTCWRCSATTSAIR